MIWFVFVLLCLTAYRLTRLIVKDTFPPVLWIRDRLAGGWRPLTDKEWEIRNWNAAHGQADVAEELSTFDGVAKRYVRRKPWSPHWLAELLSCPWCASAYVSGALVAAVDLVHGIPVPWLQGPAVWAVAAVLASREEL